jgi:AAA domain, putative AbiEii toxin, Type IV TA system
MGTSSFRDLLETKLSSARVERDRSDEELSRIADEIAEERTRKAGLLKLQQQRTEKNSSIEKNKKERDALLNKGKAADAAVLNQVRSAVETKREQVGDLKQREQAIRGLIAEVGEYRTRTIPGLLAELKDQYADAGLNSDEWKRFGLTFVGETDALLAQKLKEAKQSISKEEGAPEPLTIMASAVPEDVSKTHLPAKILLADVELRILEREMKRLNTLVGVDAANARKLTDLSERISREETELRKLDQQIERAKAADSEIKELQSQRTNTYKLLLGAIIAEQTELQSLYQPLAERLEAESGSLDKLSFYVRRSVDAAKWAADGEALLNLRKSGVFKGKGTLLSEAEKRLLKPWREGTAEEAANALAAFREAFDEKLAEHAPMEKSERDKFLQWGQRVAQWLYSADHISVSYDLRYDGVGIEQLSPGTRGIVLLLLYLTVDADDARPLIIDQPEENLDPRSVVTDLVDRFREARTRRQIIIVTHNANLVVNTDVAQVIVAHSGSHHAGELPIIEYQSGGLEDPAIREQVCTILEGGERAFKERARRLRMTL